MRKILPYLPFIIILAITFLLFIKVTQSTQNQGHSLDDNLMIGQKITDMELDTLKGPKLNFQTYQDKYTLINLFASWCTACLYEHPLVSKLKDEKGLNLIGIAWRDKKPATVEWLKQHGSPYGQVALDESGKYGILLGVTGIPETYLVNPDGIIVMHIRGTIDEDGIKAIREEITK